MPVLSLNLLANDPTFKPYRCLQPIFDPSNIQQRFEPPFRIR